VERDGLCHGVGRRHGTSRQARARSLIYATFWRWMRDDDQAFEGGIQHGGRLLVASSIQWRVWMRDSAVTVGTASGLARRAARCSTYASCTNEIRASRSTRAYPSWSAPGISKRPPGPDGCALASPSERHCGSNEKRQAQDRHVDRTELRCPSRHRTCATVPDPIEPI
jgi:hypothetical protein